MRPIRKLDDMPTRIQEQGRIRFGKKNAQGFPTALSAFRFTSADESAIHALAALYGGTPRPWADAKHKGEWDLESEAPEIRVVLPPDPLRGTPIYELWSGGGVQRRCDGETSLVPSQTADGMELAEVPCVCDARQEMLCKPKTRLSVILPDVRFGGTWRLESGGWTAAQEIPGMVGAIQALQDRRLVIAKLRLKKDTVVFAGKTKHFTVPYLVLDNSAEELAAGAATLAALAPASPEAVAPLQEIGPGEGEAAGTPPTTPPDHWDDDEIVDAEIVQETEAGKIPRPSTPPPSPGESNAQRGLMFALLQQAGLHSDLRAAFAMGVSGGRTEHTSQLTKAEMSSLLDVLKRCAEGELVFNGVRPDGKADLSVSTGSPM